MKLFTGILFVGLTFNLFAIDPSEIDTSFLRKNLPEYPNSVLFEEKYMPLLSGDPKHQIEATRTYGGKYKIVEDLNGDGTNDVAISGLVDTNPIKGNIVGFVAVFLEDKTGFRKAFLQEFRKSIDLTQAETISNIALFVKNDGGHKIIDVSFRIETGWTYEIQWTGKSFQGEEFSY